MVDRQGQVVTGLRADDFQVLEDGEPQTITTFAAEFPIAVAIAIDRSFSMAGERLAWAKSAARDCIGALRDKRLGRPGATRPGTDDRRVDFHRLAGCPRGRYALAPKTVVSRSRSCPSLVTT